MADAAAAAAAAEAPEAELNADGTPLTPDAEADAAEAPEEELDADGNPVQVESLEGVDVIEENPAKISWDAWQSKIHKLNKLQRYIPLPSIKVKLFDKTVCPDGEDKFMCKTDFVSQ
mmetsp:Transcript_29638/g.24953  ORF Transcript_29638/g.24953 Transcript_29638/m.24953 type:complete len:117 (+) Transcript_29638:207-557(+)